MRNKNNNNNNNNRMTERWRKGGWRKGVVVVDRGVQLEMAGSGTLRRVEKKRVEQGRMRKEDRSGRGGEAEWEGRKTKMVRAEELSRAQKRNRVRGVKGVRQRKGRRARHQTGKVR